MAENIHPGSFVGDSVEEFKKLPTWAKVLAVVVLAVVAYLGYRAHQSNTTAQSAAAGTAGTPGASNGASGSTSPFPSVNGVPLLPSGVNPIFDSGGSLVGYQQSGSSGSSSGSKQPPASLGQPPANKPVSKPPVVVPKPIINTKNLAGSAGNAMNTKANITPHITSVVPQKKPVAQPTVAAPAAKYTPSKPGNLQPTYKYAPPPGHGAAQHGQTPKPPAYTQWPQPLARSTVPLGGRSGGPQRA